MQIFLMARTAWRSAGCRRANAATDDGDFEGGAFYAVWPALRRRRVIARPRRRAGLVGQPWMKRSTVSTSTRLPM